MWWRRVSGCSIRGIKLTMKNHISLSVNLYWIKKWSDLEIKSGNWLYGVKYSKSQPLKSQCQSKIKFGNPHEVKRKNVTRFNIMQAQVEEVVFMFNLEYRLPLYQEGYHMDCWQSLNAQRSLKTQVSWVKHNGLIHYTSHWTRKNKTVQFPKLECPILPVMAIIQILDVLVSRLDVPVSTG
jgi:hypothetical protein